MEKLLRSRRFWLAVFGLAQAVILQYVPAIPSAVWQSLLVVVMAAIIALTVDDTGKRVTETILRATLDKPGADRIITKAIESWDK